ncbi:MAG: hypothetical protein AB1757_26925 [Acidobacteriota bacterium]
MIDRILKYQASAFVKAEQIVPDPKIISELTPIYGKHGLFPTIIQEQTPTGNSSRISFKSINEQIHLLLMGKRFDFVYLGFDGSYDNFDEFSYFCRIGSEMINEVTGYFNLQPHRLASVKEFFLKEMSEEEMNKVASILLNLPQLYSKHLPFEWDWRAGSYSERTFGNKTERSISLTGIHRQVANISRSSGIGETLDRIRIQTDINTDPKNIQERFNSNDISSYFSESPQWHDEIVNEIINFIS